MCETLQLRRNSFVQTKIQAHSDPVITGTFVHIIVPIIAASNVLWGIIVVITKVSSALPTNNKLLK